MNTQACCSHSTITRITEDFPGGFKSEYWKCDTCETNFAPEPLMQGRVLRDWFAGQALTGLVSRCDDFDHCVSVAYNYADAMLAERNKK